MLIHKVNLNNRRRHTRLAQLFALLVSIIAFAGLQLTVQAADGTFSLGGDTTVVTNTPALGHPKAFQSPSTCTRDCLRGDNLGQLTTSSVIYLPDHTLRFKDLQTLSTDFRRMDGDCGGGSPRFEIALDTNGDGEIDGRVFVYLGPLYNYVRCSRDWENTGSLVHNASLDRWDITQFRGPFYATFREAVNRLGEAAICYIILVVDGSWFPDRVAPTGFVFRQTFQFDNVRINNDVYNANQALSLTKLEGPTLARLALENYVTGVSAPQNIFSEDNFLGRRYSLRTLLRMLGGSRTTTQGRGVLDR